MKSASASRQRPKRSRAFRRGAWFSETSDEDLKWLWAAYKMGGWDERLFPEGLNQDEFVSLIGEVSLGANLVTLKARVVRDGRVYEHSPVGLIFEGYIGGRVEPHVEWLPWASPRNKVEAILKYLNVRRKQQTIVVWAGASDKDFYRHMAKYGVLREIGTVTEPVFYGESEGAVVFHTKSPREVR